MITISVRVNLDFLGEEYGDSYLKFKAIPIDEIEKYQSELVGASDKSETESLTFMRDFCADRFLSGMVKEDGKELAVTKDDMGSFPISVLSTSIERMIGRPDPKS